MYQQIGTKKVGMRLRPAQGKAVAAPTPARGASGVARGTQCRPLQIAWGARFRHALLLAVCCPTLDAPSSKIAQRITAVVEIGFASSIVATS